MLVGCESNEEAPAAPKPPVAASTPKVEPSAEAKPETPRIKTAEAPTKLGAQSEEYGLATGKKIPGAKATDLKGNTVELESLAEKGPLLLIFYRGGWCPYCNFQIRAMAAAYKDFQARGVEVVMVSVDEVSESAKTSTAFELPFPVLSDVSGEMHKAFRVYKKDKAVPSIYVLDEGKVRFSHIDEDYTKRPSAEQVNAMLDELGYPKK